MRSIPELIDTIRRGGGKVTPQRLLIYRLLQDTDTHPSAEGIWSGAREVMPTLSLTTVYKTLNELAEMGELKRFDIEGVAHFDANTEPHGEAVCLRCRRIVDVAKAPSYDELTAQGFRVTRAALTLYGYCATCEAGEVDEPIRDGALARG